MVLKNYTYLEIPKISLNKFIIKQNNGVSMLGETPHNLGSVV